MEQQLFIIIVISTLAVNAIVIKNSLLVVLSLAPIGTVTKTHTVRDVCYGGTTNSYLQRIRNCTGESIYVYLMFGGKLVIGPPFNGLTCDCYYWLPTVKFVV